MLQRKMIGVPESTYSKLLKILGEMQSHTIDKKLRLYDAIDNLIWDYDSNKN